MYASVAELAQYLGSQDLLVGTDLANQGKNNKWAQALTAASKIIDQDCGRTFSSRVATRQLVPSGESLLEIPDLVSVTQIKVDDDADGIFEVTLASGNYELNAWDDDERWPYEYIIRLDRPWPPVYPGTRSRLVEITGTWGWSQVPAEIKQATLIMGARLVQRGNAALGVQGVSDFGPFSIRNNDPDFGHLIAPFRRHGLA